MVDGVVLTAMPVFLVKFAITFAYAFLGTASEPFEPKVTVPADVRVDARDRDLVAPAGPAP